MEKDITCKRIPYTREVRTNEYLPQVIGDAKEMIAINAVNDVELERIWKILNDAYYNRFICSADSEGLRRYEDIIGIPSEGSLEERRRKVHYEWNKQTVYTDRTLRSLMNDLLGSGGYFLEIFYDQYIVDFEVRIAPGSVSPDYVKKEIRRIIPANLGIKFGVYVETALIFETSYKQAKWRYILTGERNCGVIPWYNAKGVQFIEGVVIGIKDEVFRNEFLRASEEAFLNKQRLNPRTLVDTEIVIDNEVPFKNDKHYPVLESGSYR